MLKPAEGINVMAMYRRPAAEVLTGWVTMTEFLLERADKARHLVAKG